MNLDQDKTEVPTPGPIQGLDVIAVGLMKVLDRRFGDPVEKDEEIDACDAVDWISDYAPLARAALRGGGGARALPPIDSIDPATGEPDNRARANRVVHLSCFYQEQLLEEVYEGTDAAALACIVTDMRHWCDAHAVDFDRVLHYAESLYQEEQLGHS